MKLGDFGLTKDLNKLTKTLKLSGTLPYMSPEMHQEKCDFNAIKCDIW
jgi:hypothetical protein